MTTEPVTKPTRGQVDWKDVKSLYLQGMEPADIAKKLNVNRLTINVGLSKRGITKLEREAPNFKDLQGLSRSTRDKLARKVEKMADCLPDPPKGLQNQNIYADTLQKVAKTAGGIHGWGEGAQIAVIVAGDISGRPEQDAIEVESTSELATEGQQTDLE